MQIRKMMRWVLALGLLGGGVPAYSGEWRVGPVVSFVSGISDVADIYEENYNNTHTFTQVDVKFVLPIGIAAQGTYTSDTGLRFDFGLGPVFLMRDDDDDDDDYDDDDDFDTGLDHTEVPVSATVGYTFIPDGDVSPYVRGGLVHHFASGTYVEGSSPGLLGAVGVEFMRQEVARVFIELAIDTSEVELERFKRVGGIPVRTTEDVNSYKTMFSVGVKF